MSRTISARGDRISVLDLSGADRETAEQMYDAVNNDFMRMRTFRQRNPRAQLAGVDRAWVCPGDNLFFVNIMNVQNIDTKLAATEASEFGGTVACVGGDWILSVPLQHVAPLGFAVTTWLAVLVLVVAAVAVMWPGPSWIVAQRLYAALLPLVARARHALFG